MARLLGSPLMPWQQLVADVGGEIDPETGLPAYREVWFSVMRQSGKTTLALPWQVHRCIAPVWAGEPQRAVYTAQTGWEAQKKLLDDQVPVIQRSPLAKLITPAGGGKIRRAQGNWGVNFGSTGKIDVLGSSTSSGHGSVIDLGVLDEVWKDEDDRREQAILPAMLTRPRAQMLGYSTMGTDASTYFNRKVKEGRAAALADRGSGIAYFEWSIPEDADIGDPEVWWQFMPALGWTITEAAVAHAYQTMAESEFRRAFGNQRAASEQRLIPSEVWDQVRDPSAEPGDGLRFGVDMDTDRDSWSVVASDGTAVEVIDHGAATPRDWFADRESRRRVPVVIDTSGPAAPLADDLEQLGVTVTRRTRGEVADDCARLYDAIADGIVRVRPSEALDAAVAGAVRRPVGDRFVWSRSGSGADATPLYGATLAYAHKPAAAAVPRIRTLGG